MRNSLAPLPLAPGQCTMVNRFSPPCTGLGALGFCPALSSTLLHVRCKGMAPSSSLTSSLENKESSCSYPRPQQKPPCRLSLTTGSSQYHVNRSLSPNPNPNPHQTEIACLGVGPWISTSLWVPRAMVTHMASPPPSLSKIALIGLTN